MGSAFPDSPLWVVPSLKSIMGSTFPDSILWVVPSLTVYYG